METKRTKATDIAEICTLLDGKVDFQTISFNQVLTTDHGKSINDLLFVSKQYGICEMALKDDGFTGYEYVVFGEYSAGVIETITKQTGYYGEIYRYCYCAEQMALEKDTPGNPKGTTGGGSQ